MTGVSVQPIGVGLFILVQALLLVYSTHRYLTLWRWARRRGVSTPDAPDAPSSLPQVTVQLPLYNERLVAERLIDAVAAMDYPVSRLQIQVLDDSTDETSDRAVAAVARHRARGIDIEMLHRSRRDGYKAGALAAGLERARGEIILIFDADFVPRPDFLRRMVPSFADPEVGMVQARWGHLNRDRSLLTAAQAAMLDAHFLLEHGARMSAGLFFNFNGTAGAWRRTCIESAGGWTHDTLTEDLDLSYRAQLLGWRFVSVPVVVAPAELPANVEALMSQQRRWVRGSIQTARKLLPAVFRSTQPVRVKVEAFFHLTNNFAYPLLLLSGLLLLPVMMATSTTLPLLSIALDVSVILTGIVPVCAFLASGQLAQGVRGWSVVRDVGAVLVLGAGLTVNNAWAVLQGLRHRVGDWDRTPKTGDGGPGAPLEPYAPKRTWSGWLELLLALCFAWLSGLAWHEGHLRSMPFLLLLGTGLTYVGAFSVRRRFGGARRGAMVATCAVLAITLGAAWGAAWGGASGIGAKTPSRSSASHAPDPEFGSYWHDGKAELDGYRLTVMRYGQPRVGHAVLVYVTEPFSDSKHVKVEDAARSPHDTFDALKLNLVRRFQTGIYDYHTMVSVFTRSRDFTPVKITFTSAEWCGQVYEHLDFSGARMTARFDSYFEGESSTSALDVPRDGVTEDNLFILLRGLRGAYLKPGEKRSVSFLPSSFYRRLTHRGLAWSSASIERLARAETVRVPAGEFVTDPYVVRTSDGREGRFQVERDYPHRVVRWAWNAATATRGRATGLGGTDSGELTGSDRLVYWKLHDPGDEKYLERLGLAPVVK